MGPQKNKIYWLRNNGAIQLKVRPLRRTKDLARTFVCEIQYFAHRLSIDHGVPLEWFALLYENALNRKIRSKQRFRTHKKEHHLVNMQMMTDFWSTKL
jgi:hypothetical protein